MKIAKTSIDKYIILSDNESKLVSVKVDGVPTETIGQIALNETKTITWNGWAGNNFITNYTLTSGTEHKKFKGVLRELVSLRDT